MFEIMEQMVLVVSGKKKIIFIWQGREELRDRERERETDYSQRIGSQRIGSQRIG